MKKLILPSILLVALSAIGTTQAQTTYENYAITTLTTTTSFIFPKGLAVDSAGNLYVSDLLRYVIYRITPDGQQTVFVGKNGVPGSVDGKRRLPRRLAGPSQLAFDRQGNLYFGDGNGLGDGRPKNQPWRSGHYSGWFADRIWQRRRHRQRCPVWWR